VAGNCTHGVIGDTSRRRTAHPSWVREEGVEAAVASLTVCQHHDSMW
jgi:hypothetical protein